MKLAPGTQPFNNLDDIIPFVYGMEGELDERLKELGMELKIRRSLPPDEQKKVPYPFPGEYLFGSTVPQQAEKGKSFLYVIMSREMWYFGWSDTPGFEKRLKVGTKTDGASMYYNLTRSEPRPPTVTCYLIGKCDDADKKIIEAKLITSGYVAYLLGLHNPVRTVPSPRGYSINKCVSLYLLDSNSWKEICAFVALFWGYEPMLAKYVTVE